MNTMNSTYVILKESSKNVTTSKNLAIKGNHGLSGLEMVSSMDSSFSEYFLISEISIFIRNKMEIVQQPRSCDVVSQARY